MSSMPQLAAGVLGAGGRARADAARLCADAACSASEARNRSVILRGVGARVPGGACWRRGGAGAGVPPVNGDAGTGKDTIDIGSLALLGEGLIALRQSESPDM